ncbi:MAG TPA: ATP-binding protein [Candidatus Kryptonia bacterium]|nr:ATP-binding protein [Candidatus Kryptonia bacterium]
MADAVEAALLAKFDAETRRLVRWRTIVGCALVLTINPLYILSDYWLYPVQFALLASSNLVCLVATGVVLIAMYRPIGKAYPHWFGVFLCLELGFATAGVPVLLLGPAASESAGFMLIILGVALLMPWQMVHGVLVSGLFLAMYVVCALAHGPIDGGGHFWANVSLIVTASVVGLVSMRAGAALHWREFRTRNALEEAVRQETELAAALEEKRAQLQLTNQEMEDLLYVASHDLRAPLINVQGFTRELQIAIEALRRELPASPEVRALVTDVDESIRFILTAVARMDGLIGSLLNLSRIATRTNPTEVVPLGPMVDKIIDSFRFQIDQKRITIAIDALPVVIGDPVRLNQAVSNLVDNAIKYMGDRPVRRIEIGASSANGTCTCYVRDSGSGIPKAKHETIFRLFHRLGGGNVPGEGIGLTMVRKIIEKHGGRVWVEAMPDEGSTFFFTLRPATAAGTVEEGPQ